MLLVERDGPAPLVIDELEDWVRDPIDGSDFEARIEGLLTRASGISARPPIELVDGLIRVGDRWTSVPQQQWSTVSLLVDRLGSMVSDSDIARAYSATSGSDDPRAVKSMVRRMSRRLETVGLVLHRVRGRGCLLDFEPSSG